MFVLLTVPHGFCITKVSRTCDLRADPCSRIITKILNKKKIKNKCIRMHIVRSDVDLNRIKPEINKKTKKQFKLPLNYQRTKLYKINNVMGSIPASVHSPMSTYTPAPISASITNTSPQQSEPVSATNPIPEPAPIANTIQQTQLSRNNQNQMPLQISTQNQNPVQPQQNPPPQNPPPQNPPPQNPPPQNPPPQNPPQMNHSDHQNYYNNINYYKNEYYRNNNINTKNDYVIKHWQAFNDRIIKSIKEERARRQKILLLDVHSFPKGSFNGAQIAIIDIYKTNRVKLDKFAIHIINKMHIDIRIFNGLDNHIQNTYKTTTYPLLLEFCEDRTYLLDETIKVFCLELIDYFTLH